MASALRLLTAALVAAAFFGAIEPAWAVIGQPAPWELGMQQAATPVMADIVWFNDFLLWIITGIVILVLALLVTVIMRFNVKANPVSARTTHNTVIELIWTVIPVMILVLIAVPSFRLMFFQLDTPPADLTVKATGKQWFWTYSYPDNGNFEFDSLLACNSDRTKCQSPRLLAVDNEMVVPVNKVVRVQTIGADVIHEFAVPSFGVRIDAIPGRLNEAWFKATHEGVYYGQCAQLCGRDHAFMPIAIRVVSEKAFADWVKQAKQKYADNDAEPLTVAAAAPRHGK
jgi:cytochrome c oxidase subunit II